MEPAARTAVVGASLGRLCDDLRTLPTRPEVRSFPSLYGDTGEMVSFRPQVLFVPLRDDDEEATGALRILRGMLPGLGVVVVGEARREMALVALCERIGARLLLQPFGTGQLAATLEHALCGSERPREEVFLDLARGIADELNNPLMYVSGYLQLLKASFDPVTDRDRRDQLASAVAGVQRIQGTIERIQLLSQAANGARVDQRVDLRQLLDGELVAAGQAAPMLLLEPEAADFTVPGQPDLLQPAVAALLQVVIELAQFDCAPQLYLTRLQEAVRLRATITGSGLQAWRLPRSFEPYYLNRILRGSPHGLSLFLTQTVVLAHGGQAMARRLPDGSICLDLLLPV